MTSLIPVSSQFVRRALSEPPAETKPKLTKAEQRAIDKEEAKFFEFTVVLDDQATREVERAFDMPNDMKRRAYVAETLIENMKKTQAPLWKVLDGLQAAGNVSSRRSYRPLWIQNSIIVHGDETAMAVMSHAAGVAQAIKSARMTVGDASGGAAAASEALAPIEDSVSGAAAALNDLPTIDPTTPILTPSEAGSGAGGEGEEKDLTWGLTRMRIAKARQDGLTGAGTVTAVIDTGVDFSHPALVTKYRGYNPDTGDLIDIGSWYDSVEDPSPIPVDDNGHGTHVAGAIGSDRAGVAPGTALVAARGLGPQGGSDGMLLTAFQNVVAPRVPTPGVSPGSKRVLQLGPHVINNSWGSDDGTSMSYTHALHNMSAMGIINVFAAGNDGGAGRSTIGSPASSPHIISVAAVDASDAATDFSSKGPNPLPGNGDEPVPFISAPGSNKWSTVPGGGFEGGWQGTSMAAPDISGFLELGNEEAIKQTGYPLDTRGAKEFLKRTAEDIGAPGPDDATGYGIPVADDIPGAIRSVVKDLKLPSKVDASTDGPDEAAENSSTPPASASAPTPGSEAASEELASIEA